MDIGTFICSILYNHFCFLTLEFANMVTRTWADWLLCPVNMILFLWVLSCFWGYKVSQTEPCTGCGPGLESPCLSGAGGGRALHSCLNLLWIAVARWIECIFFSRCYLLCLCSILSFYQELCVCFLIQPFNQCVIPKYVSLLEFTALPMCL